MSKWLVGSSKIKKFALDNISFASETRPRSPPLKSRIYLNTSSFVNKNAARVLRICVLFKSGQASCNSSNKVLSGSNTWCSWSQQPIVTLEPSLISPESAGRISLIIFKIVVFPVPLLPIRATRSPRLMSKLMSVKSVLSSNALLKCETLKTSLPLITDGFSSIFILSFISAGLSTTSSLSSIFSRLSARLMDFSRLNCFNFVITSC